MFKKIKEKLNYLERGKFCEECGVFTNKYKKLDIVIYSYNTFDMTKYYCFKCSPNYNKVIHYPVNNTIYLKDDVEVDEKGKII